VFSGGTYDDVARWLLNFLLSHAKREHPRVEVVFEAGDEREGKSYAARLTLDGRSTSTIEFDYPDVAARRGELAWCQAMAARTRQAAHGLLSAGDMGGPEMASHTPQRSERPGGAVPLLDNRRGF